MNAEQQKLYKTIDEILWFEWDPKGINNVGDRAAYDRFVPQVYHLKTSGSSKMEIADYLEKIVTMQLGLDSMRGVNEKIAAKIFGLE